MKSIIIIGSGMGGLATGIYAQRNGFLTTIFESHGISGGQCTSWKRKGYVFDPTLHHLNGFRTKSRVNAFWHELGALPCERIERNEFVSAVFPDGTWFHNQFDLDKLEAQLKELSPEDTEVIDEYINGIKLFITDFDLLGINYFGSFLEKLSLLPFLVGRMKYFKYSLGSFGARFRNPYLRKVFPLLRYSVPEVPLFGYLAEHANFINGDSGWPRGGGISLAQNMTAQYLKLGGTIHYNKEVAEILVENHRACGIKLKDGTQYNADFVVSNADGRKTIMEMLNGRYLNRKVSRNCEPNLPDKAVVQSTQIFLGVNRDLSSYPSALMLFFDKPEMICGHECDHIDMQLYGFDTSMAPEGKGIIKIELATNPSYFSDLYQDKNKYNEEKSRIANQLISLLERQFPDLMKDIEVIDVSTLNTWERYMKGSQGFNNFPNKYQIAGVRNVINSIFGLDRMYTLPGLKNFFFAGQWVTSMGSLFSNAASGREVAQKICKQYGVRFKST